MEELAPGIFRWTAPHPEWRPRSEEVESYALVAGEALLLVDPLLPADADERRSPLLAELELLVAAAARVELLVTVPYHTRSAEALYERYAPERPTRIWGHALVRRRLRPETPLEVVPMGAAGTAAPIAGGAAEAYTVGRPRRSEHPVYVPKLRAAVFGDAVVGAQGGAPLLVPEQHRRRLVPRRVRADAGAPGRAAARARARHPRAAGDRRRAAAAGAVPRVAAGEDVLTPAATTGAPGRRQAGRRLSPSGASPRAACAARCARG